MIPGGINLMTKPKPTIYQVATTELKDQHGFPADMHEFRLQAKNLKGKWINLKYPTEMRVINKPGRKKK